MGVTFHDHDAGNPSNGKHYLVNVYYQNNHVFVVSMQVLNFAKFLAGCRRLLLSQLGVRTPRLIAHVRRAATAGSTTLCRLKTERQFRQVFGGASSSNRRNIYLSTPAAGGHLLHRKLVLTQPTPNKPVEAAAPNGLAKIESEAKFTRSLAGQMRLLDKAFRQLPAPASVSSGQLERRRKQYRSMLVAMRQNPARAGRWLSKMRRLHQHRARMLRILSIFDIFVGSLQKQV